MVAPRVHHQSPQQKPYAVSINVGNLAQSDVQVMSVQSSQSQPVKRFSGNLSQSDIKIMSVQGVPQKRLLTVDDIPDDAETLNVEQLCDCLVILDMSGHVNKFRQKQIDGRVLSGCKQTYLMNDLGVSDLQASKLLRFMRGWRP